MILLSVPYAEKDSAKLLGARWDAEQKKWYVPKGVLATPFERWMPGGAEVAKLLSKKPKQAATKKPRDRSRRRPDSSGGRVVVGTNYVPVADATGLPWDV